MTALLLALSGPALFGTAVAVADPADLYNSAQSHFMNGQDAAGLDDLHRLLDEAPDDAQALALQAIWSDYTGDVITREVALHRLDGVDPGEAAQTRTMIGAVASAVATVPMPLPTLVGEHTGIVVLGYGLLPDGSMRDELVDRLEAAWFQAMAAPWAPVVVTGGNPQNGVAEAAAMAGWLIGRGIPADRVLVEDRAGSTVQNALFSSQLLRGAGADNAVLVTSPNHIRRAVADFITAGIHITGAMTSTDQWVNQLMPPGRPAQRGIYIDASRVMMLPPAR
ncbi:YdcF family protein [Nocardia sp. alder85J]|uniref:YdcF family protein n=1 Tax=Nocardia sp. alder85J TaxID=2862949 RepID=UPI001CD74E07|nr:YdcF family protein [Nocardia sp. alder85J]MCX4092704.1 YdcF family protein [Nocardia sp. alder85J]